MAKFEIVGVSQKTITKWLYESAGEYQVCCLCGRAAMWTETDTEVLLPVCEKCLELYFDAQPCPTGCGIAVPLRAEWCRLCRPHA